MTNFPTIPTGDRLALTSIGHSGATSRWRTESMRAHSAPRLVVFTKGQGRITIAGKVSGFGPNNLVFLPKGTLYGIELGPTAFGHVLTIPPAMADDWPETVAHLRLRDVAAIKDLQGLLDALERELGSDEPGALRAAHYRTGLLAIYVLRQIQHQNSPAPRDTAAERLVAAYSELIARDFKSHLGVGDYAARLGVTPTHLTRCCKQTCGRSALNLLNDRVMFEARLLLRNGRAPIQDVAAELGFTSPAYFTRAFQAETGMTPSAFRARGPVGTL